MKLENAVTTAKRREKLAYRVVVVSGIVGYAMWYCSATKIFGEAAPFSKGASAVFNALFVICFVATVTFWVGLASYFSRFRPGVREAKEQLRDASILEIHRELRELRKYVTANLPNEGPT